MVPAPSTGKNTSPRELNISELATIESFVSLAWAHCEQPHEMRCKHDNPYCWHHPSRWIQKYIRKGRWGLKPIFYNTQPEPYLWFEQEQWLE